jgi:hypothetical protein
MTVTEKQLIVDAELKDLIPPLTTDELSALEANLLRDGLLDALKVWRTDTGDVLLDGYNRYGICAKHGIEYRVEPVPGISTREDAKAWMVQHQLGRRNLNESQRAMLAGRMATLRDGQHKPAGPIGPASQSEVAKKFNVGHRSVKRARVVQEHGILELARLVTAGELAVSVAAAVATLPVDEQRTLVAAGVEAIKEAARQMRHGEEESSISPVENVSPVIPQSPTTVETKSGLIPAANGLLPCAQCGADAKYMDDYDFARGPVIGVICSVEQCSIQTSWRRTKEEAAASWNRRPGSEA